MIVSGLTDVGVKRDNNEDAIFASSNKDFPLFIVADGMGGHNAGDVASKMTVDLVKEGLLDKIDSLNSPRKIKKVMLNILEEANETIYKKSVDELTCEGMGTTVVLAYYFQNKMYIGHAGDSRAYIIKDKAIKQITDDHTLVNELVKKGSITESQATSHPQRNMITRALGTSEDIEIDINIVDFNDEDILVLCSDGLYNMVHEEVILEILMKNESLEDKVKDLVDMANKNGGSDNISVVVAKFNKEVLE